MTDIFPTPPARATMAGEVTPDIERAVQELHVERRAYMEDVEDAVAETEAASTPLDHRLMQLGNRSYEVVAEAADRQIRGRVSHVSGEIATIETIGGAHFCVHLDRVMSFRYIDMPGETRGVDTGEPATLIARLRELWTRGERCTVGRVTGAAVLGDLKAVTESHVEITDPQGSNWLIPMNTIAWVGPKL